MLLLFPKTVIFVTVADFCVICGRLFSATGLLNFQQQYGEAYVKINRAHVHLIKEYVTVSNNVVFSLDFWTIRKIYNITSLQVHL